MGNLFFYILLLFQGSVNRFFVKGEGSILYTHNNGKLANDPKLACQNFLSALERIPKVIATHEKELAKATKDIDVYKAISSGVWNKEDELRNIKAQAAELDRKIALTLNPPSEENVAKEGQQTRSTQEQTAPEHRKWEYRWFFIGCFKDVEVCFQLRSNFHYTKGRETGYHEQSGVQ